jgi:uridylate kinase
MSDELGAAPKYKRALLKLSGEAFADPQHGFGIDPRVVASIARQVAEAQSFGAQLGIVVG